MSIFGDIMNKIFHHPAATQTGTSTGTTGAPPTDMSSSSAASTLIATAEKMASDMLSSATAKAPLPATDQTAATPSGTPHNVDVGVVLASMAQEKGGGGDYQHSIVDLLKLLDLDSSLEARKHLGEELGVHAGADGSAQQNIALHKAVTQGLAANGGRVPAAMMG